ncbi:helix-turn-helix domain-containing protein [Lysinibacter cavernae]|uniref:Helix-turn-helix domain-containing protein n=1 Tax=Lysinibacter cavernae TaxID=1640652 RepID=A0A7X5QYY8_9MICO|nr:helix-turn-helix domain-containing protein [Lysinibacter cavernae]NIH52526.1 hypothetical protein [Lysinibacter cavernae]
MSNRALHWAWELELPMSQKFVLIALADMADEAHSCYPGQKMLAKMVGGSVDTIQRALTGLEGRGAISRKRRFREDGYRTSDRYVLSVGEVLKPEKKLKPQNPTLDIPTQDSAPTLGRNLPHLRPQKQGGKNHQLTTREPSVNPDTAFDEFWKVYPRKAGKAAALKSFLKAAAAVGTEVLLEAVKRYASDPGLPREKRFIPHPATWLNQGRWDDEPEAGNGGQLGESVVLVHKLREEESREAFTGSRAIDAGAGF